MKKLNLSELRVIVIIFLTNILVFAGVIVGDEVGGVAKGKYPFYALCMDTHDAKRRNIEQQNEMLRELGFDGVAHLWLKGLPERVASAKKNSLKVMQVYFAVNLSANPPFDQQLANVLPCLKGEGTQLALLISGGKPSDTSFDAKAVEVIGQIMAIAEKSEISVVIYPHRDFLVEKVSDAVRIASKFPDGKVGVMFNLCHWAAVDKSENLESVLNFAKPYLAAVTINGTDTPEEIKYKKGNWLQPLDKGSFQMKTLLDLLEKIDYCGSIGLQCYGIGGDAKEHITRSIKKWRSLNGIDSK
ncbi:MAG: sugar phosphate isomerase/epimerase [Planctomycetaceae bacterium]|jgi:sugar phosphate isomerase/epimerase|nr:sugar phosphate isomerase/epimerase [Planctomycetaceae bacterium]